VQTRLVLHIFFPLTAAMSLALFTDVAKATSVTTPITDGTLTASLDALPPLSGVTTLVDLTGVTAPSDATLSGTGYTITFSNFSNLPQSCAGDEGIVQGSDACHAVPVAGGSASTPELWTGNYLSTGGPNATGVGESGQITITFTSPETSLELLWGSIDGCFGPSSCSSTSSDIPGNSLALSNGTTVTGYELETALGLTNLGVNGVNPVNGGQANGNTGYGGSAWVVINTTTPFTTVTLTSTISSFESADIVASDIAPEPGSVLLVGTGLGLSALLRRSTLRKRLKKR
jgi:hypothetical protein